MIVVSNRVQILDDRVETFVDSLRTNHDMEEQLGFPGLKLLSPVDAEGHITMTFWDSREDYETWRDGTAFERAYDDSLAENLRETERSRDSRSDRPARTDRARNEVTNELS